VNQLILVRHGESLWNKEGRFTGWTDVGLSERGVEEALEAGRILKQEGYTFEVAYTSVLKRAIKTLWLILEEMDRMWIPVYRSWRLNERHYGALQGFSKKEMARVHGEEQVHLWRRSYEVRPPALTVGDERYPGNEARYRGLRRDELPLTECLKDTVERFLPYWHEAVSPMVKAGKQVIISAHGNSLRALVKYLDNIADADIPELNIPTGIPLVYELKEDLTPLDHYYLGDAESERRATQAATNPPVGGTSDNPGS